MINAERILLLISSTLFLSYISGIIYNKTKIPDLVWLLIFGIILGPVLGVFQAEIFLGVFDLMVLVTVSLFAFGTGLSFNVQQLLGHTSRALNLALANFLAITFSVGVAVNFLLPDHFNLVSGFLLGAMLGGIDGVSISSLIHSLEQDHNRGESELIIQLESTLADPIKVVGVLTIIKMVFLTGAGPRTAGKDILFTLVFSAFWGISSGLLWGQIISRLRDRPLNYMMTIAFLFPIYVISDVITDGGGGPISVFLFAAVLMNYGYVTNRLNLERRSRIDRRKIREYHDEITFFIKSLFFVYLGVVMKFNVLYLEVSALLTILIIAMRFIVVTVLYRLRVISKEQVGHLRLFFIAGASSLVLAQLVANYDPTGIYLAEPELFSTLVVPIVLFSIAFSSIIAPLIEKLLPIKEEPETKKESKE